MEMVVVNFDDQSKQRKSHSVMVSMRISTMMSQISHNGHMGVDNDDSGLR